MFQRLRPSESEGTALISALVVFLPVVAAAFDGAVRATATLGVDSNAPRDFRQGAPQADGFMSGVLSLQGRVGEQAQAAGAYDVGFRKFFNLSSEDILVQSAIAEASLALGKKWIVGVQGRGKDRRGGERSYTDLVGAAFIEFNVVDPLDVRVLAGAHRFLYRAFFPYSFSAPELGLQARYRFDKHHSINAFGEIGFRNYNAMAQSNPDLPPPPEQVQRKDDAYVASLGYRYRGPFTLSATYSYVNLASNSFGESIRRHRIAATSGFRLPWKLTLLLEGSLQFTEYPDKVYGSPDIVLVNDENLNSVSFKLVRPLDDHVDLELQFAWYQAQLPGRDMTFTYVREVGGIGLTWRL